MKSNDNTKSQPDDPSIILGIELGTNKSQTDVYVKPDYEQWLKLKEWDLTEAVYLLHNWQPRSDDFLRDEHGEIYSKKKQKIWLSQSMESTLMSLNYSIRAKKLKYIKGKISVEDLLFWAYHSDFRLPIELHREVERLRKKERGKPIKRTCRNLFDEKLLEVVNQYKEQKRPTATNLLREFYNKFGSEFDLNILPDRNSPKKIEYRNSKGKYKEMTFKTFRNKISRLSD